jgi:hypothetical protein
LIGRERDNERTREGGKQSGGVNENEGREEKEREEGKENEKENLLFLSLLTKGTPLACVAQSLWIRARPSTAAHQRRPPTHPRVRSTNWRKI